MKNVPAKKMARSLWIMLEPQEVVEIRRIKQDYDEEGALDFFRQVVAPRVRAAALQRGLALDLLTEEAADERLPR